MFFSGLFQRKSDAPVTTSAELADAIGLSYDTYTGKQISSQRAMRLTAVFSCVRVLAESVGMLPCNLYHLNGSLKQRATGERLHKLISTHPNSYMTPQEFWELVVTCLCLRGNFYAYKVKAFGEVAELLPVDPGCVVLGENILSCDTEKSIRERFSVYQVAGQRAGNDDDFGEATTTALRARTEDAFIARYRPMYIRQTGQATGAGCIARADFEARQRAARTDETTYVVQGWRQGNGTLWQPNQRVIVFDPVCGFDNTELLVSEVTFTQDQNGTLTEIRVGPPDAYLPEPEAPGARKKKKARVQEDPF
ncbi:TPA: phage portal protein [Escherichia coli]|uniref:phage portal protein n=1 Tax=Escherichia coli TaxID=562 RepID=UPI0017586813|nr:phage portal protein [Escherichia coli]EFH4003218.1 phage portal protein [Escherichia coli]EFH5114553.1 phage portal protein [Escherichia coli]EFL6811522.1 phage portal protein [Escherichia coli]EFM0111585.1 phage portal protein [Escherichia coli]EFM0448308.1 phage portal protein [Escherichia coli]